MRHFGQKQKKEGESLCNQKTQKIPPDLHVFNWELMIKKVHSTNVEISFKHSPIQAFKHYRTISFFTALRRSAERRT